MTRAIKLLDVRPLLHAGVEPFPAIMEAVAALAPQEALRLLATFRPVPLFNVMAKRGFDHTSKEIGDGDWEVLFTPSALEEELSVSPVLSAEVAAAETWAEPSEYLDLSDLDPPEPMQRILLAVERLPAGSVVFAVLSREPVFLYSELLNRGHQWAGNFDESRSAFRIFVRVGDKESGK